MMIKAIISDFSRVLLLPKDTGYKGGLNELHAGIKKLRGDYDIFDQFELNEELFDFYKSLAAGTVPGEDKYSLYIFTTGSVQNEPALRAQLDTLFKHIYAANELGWSKSHSKTYVALAEKIGVLPAEVLYIDDSAGNVEAASGAGLRAVRYKDNPQAIKEIQGILGRD